MESIDESSILKPGNFGEKNLILNKNEIKNFQV